ncbi:hypothetical protein UNDYM_3604 [Undibacterium sp. YM2]|nr:hypothetical protein UNDYM_3604 [Undibacterium sp. YM2]
MVETPAMAARCSIVTPDSGLGVLRFFADMQRPYEQLPGVEISGAVISASGKLSTMSGLAPFETD